MYNDFNLDLEFNRITKDMYEKLVEDKFMFDNGYYEKYNKPIDCGGCKVVNAADPVDSQDLVTKSYVDNTAIAIDPKIREAEIRLESEIGNMETTIKSWANVKFSDITDAIEILDQNLSDTTDAVTEVSDDLTNLDERFTNSDTRLTNAVSDINDKIPNAATSNNQLADKSFVNSSISTLTAHFDGNWSTYSSIPTTVQGFIDLNFPEPTPNNYLVVTNDENHDDETWRYKYVVDDVNVPYSKNNWKEEYKVNDTPLTSDQLKAINSTITKDIVDGLKELSKHDTIDNNNLIDNEVITTRNIKDDNVTYDKLSEFVRNKLDNSVDSEDIKLKKRFTDWNITTTVEEYTLDFVEDEEHETFEWIFYYEDGTRKEIHTNNNNPDAISLNGNDGNVSFSAVREKLAGYQLGNQVNKPLANLDDISDITSKSAIIRGTGTDSAILKGTGATASGYGSVSIGHGTLADADRAYAEGNFTRSWADSAHTEGERTVAYNKAEHAQGRFNYSHTGSTSDKNTLHSIGFGTSDNDRKNVIEVMQDGKEYVYNIGGFTGRNIPVIGDPNPAKDLATVINNKADTTDTNLIPVYADEWICNPSVTTYNNITYVFTIGAYSNGWPLYANDILVTYIGGGPNDLTIPSYYLGGQYGLSSISASRSSTSHTLIGYRLGLQFDKLLATKEQGVKADNAIPDTNGRVHGNLEFHNDDTNMSSVVGADENGRLYVAEYGTTEEHKFIFDTNNNLYLGKDRNVTRMGDLWKTKSTSATGSTSDVWVCEWDETVCTYDATSERWKNSNIQIYKEVGAWWISGLYQNPTSAINVETDYLDFGNGNTCRRYGSYHSNHVAYEDDVTQEISNSIGLAVSNLNTVIEKKADSNIVKSNLKDKRDKTDLAIYDGPIEWDLSEVTSLYPSFNTIRVASGSYISASGMKYKLFIVADGLPISASEEMFDTEAQAESQTQFTAQGSTTYPNLTGLIITKRATAGSDTIATTTDVFLTEKYEWNMTNIPDGWHVVYGPAYESDNKWHLTIVNSDESDGAALISEETSPTASRLIFGEILQIIATQIVVGYQLGNQENKQLATADSVANLKTIVGDIESALHTINHGGTI